MPARFPAQVRPLEWGGRDTYESEITVEFGQFLWSLLVIFFMIMYFMILFSVVIDLFRNHQMGGFAKALWIIFLIFIRPAT